MNFRPQISVIIPFAGESNILFKCLDKLYYSKKQINFETIVVQSGCRKSSTEKITKYENLTLIHSEELCYPGKARNLGAQKSSSNMLAFIDADCIPSDDWIETAFKSIEQGWKVVLGPILNENIFKPIASVDNMLQFIDFQKNRPATSITHFSGTNFVISKSLFQQAGGFREDLKAGEDVIFSQSVINQKNLRIFYNKNLYVYHVGRNSFKEFINHQKVFGYYRGLLNLKIKPPEFLNRCLQLYAGYWGLKRFAYICIRTVQWNLKAVLILIMYFPLIVIGLSAWSLGFYNGVKKSNDKSEVI